MLIKHQIMYITLIDFVNRIFPPQCVLVVLINFFRIALSISATKNFKSAYCLLAEAYPKRVLKIIIYTHL